MASTDATPRRVDGEQRPASPSIALPKGGGALRGIGEKFAANPVMGTGSMNVPIVSSPGRSGFGPQLTLSYDSGAGNGPFGFGWSLSLPQITRKTDKGLPQYDDANGSDVFILSGAEDLVPVLVQKHLPNRAVGTETYSVDRYRPRTEGLFARIERWTRRADGDVHWRSISKDNVLTVYGLDPNSRIVDPYDSLRVFSWLICETRDDKGQAVLYEYKEEDGFGAGLDLSRAHERNRGGCEDRRRATNRYLKHIRYGNRTSLLDGAGRRPPFADEAKIEALNADAGWLFEVVFDYGEHDADALKPEGLAPWTYRADPFSTYRAGFEVRTGRLCRRVLMFHHFVDEPGVGVDCLVRSTDFDYSPPQDPAHASSPVYAFLLTVTQSGYKRNNGGYDKRSLPSLEFEYTQPVVQDTVEEVDVASVENLPIGVDGTRYQWTDLHGEGIPGVLTEQAGSWFYKRNLSPASLRPVEFAPMELVASKPNLGLAGGQGQFMDLAGDGQTDLVVLDGPTPGLYKHDEAEGWQSFRPFPSRLNRDLSEPNLRFVDLDGDGHADVLITEADALVWHPSLAEDGFGPARRVAQALDEEKGPRLVFADGTQSIYLADLSGDGLTDLARVRNGDVCYWPNVGYGRFGAKVTMDDAPQFDNPDQFDQRRLRLADIDGSGTTDIIYLHRDGVRLYFNQSGNSWNTAHQLNVFPRVDDLVSITAADLLGNGTACLVWSSPLPGDARRPMRYVNLMGGQKPHLLVKTVNNLGAETVVQYAPSTKFSLQDKRDGRPWITRLPFPVHVVERVETYDRISRNRFVTRYAYHHGYFDGEEREFRGFGMVEQFDTEELAALTPGGAFPDDTNIDGASHVPPALTKSWFHTGVYVGRDRVSNFFAGLLDSHDVGEYYAQDQALLLPDTILPSGLTLDEEREACRAMRGSMLRQEVYALDGTPKAAHPYTVTEQNFTVRQVQPRDGNPHAVFFSHPREAVTYHYERDPADPRISHALTLEVDFFGNVLKSVAIGYRRRQADAALQLPVGMDPHMKTLITYTENRVTNLVPVDPGPVDPDAYRAPLPCETRTYELTGFKPADKAELFSFAAWADHDFARLAAAAEIDYEDPADLDVEQKRLIEHVRTLFRANQLDGLLALGTLESLALPGESYKLALTPLLAKHTYVDSGKLSQDELDAALAGEGGYVHSEGDANWWIPSGRVFLSPGSADTAAQELGYARGHFFLPHRTRDPFHTSTVSTERAITYDAYDLLMLDSRDPVGNRVTVGERLPNGDLDPTKPGNDYRVLQPWRVTDPNRNRTAVSFDILGMVVGTAVKGKPLPGPVEGDSLDGFVADLSEAVILDHLANPLADPYAVLGRATTRLVYDLFAYQRTKDQPNPQPGAVYTLARETHDADVKPGEKTKVQHGFSYSDGFGREIQKKIQAEPGSMVAGGAVVSPRWVGSGWTIFNNKGKPVRQYEPFFSTTHHFEFGVQVGVSPILFYDPVGRVVATLHANHAYEKVVFNPWRQVTWDVNDTVWDDPLLRDPRSGDPRTDSDIRGYTAGYFAGLPTGPAAQPWKTWHQEREGGALGIREKGAADKAAAHSGTPTTVHFDTLGRPFLTLADNGPNPAQPGQHLLFATRVELDIEGNQRAVRDAVKQAGDQQGRIVMRYTYDLLGSRLHQMSMESGARWTLNDVAGKPLRAWDSRGHSFRTRYDPLRRPLRSFVTAADPANPTRELLTERLVYGEQHPEAEQRNLRGKPYLHLDQAGAATTEAHDFKGNPLRASRRIAKEYKNTITWTTVDAALPTTASTPLVPATVEAALAPALEAETHTSRSSYDALNRPMTVTSPDGSVYRPTFNEANLLDTVAVNLCGGVPVDLRDAVAATPFVTNIDYDAKGQRRRIDYGNGASTFYDYDPLTFRLTHLYTRRGATYTEDCDNPHPPPPTIAAPDVPPPDVACGVQNLHYTYDPAGNITHIRDDAQQTIFFRNKRVDPSADYTYDAIYRLIEATGREHLGQVGGAPIPHSHHDAPRVGIDWAANDGNAMGTYTERYLYDAVGNFLEMQHRGDDPAHPVWKRSYTYDEVSLIEDGIGVAARKTSNRLSSTAVGPTNPTVEPYTYDAHGNMTRMPHLGGTHPAPNMGWDYRDQLREIDLGGLGSGGTAYYVYDAAGQRLRKVWEKTASLVEERLYLGGFEIYRRRDGADRLERETLHIMDDKQRIALVETRTLDTAGNDLAAQQLIRYQLGNHLGSAILELDFQAQIISYEEYAPYGSTVYQAVRSQTETPKRYRYTGKERDEESGLYYHGARYYAPWLGRWTGPDPAGGVMAASSQDGEMALICTSLYSYVCGRAIIANDPDGKVINLIAGAIGAGIGFVVGFGISAAIQVHSGKEFSWKSAVATGVGGAISGGIGGLTMGASLAVQVGIGGVGASVVGGAATRGLLGEEQTVEAATTDALVGAVTFGLGKGIGAALSKSSSAQMSLAIRELEKESLGGTIVSATAKNVTRAASPPTAPNGGTPSVSEPAFGSGGTPSNIPIAGPTSAPIFEVPPVNASAGAPNPRPRVSARAQGPGSGVTKQTLRELQSSRRSLIDLIAEHRQKLTNYKADPLAHDNLGLLQNAPSEGIRNQMIAGRIKVLEGQITKQEKELAKVNSQLAREIK